MTKLIDLHCHTTYSDGTFTPKELLAHAKERGIVGLSITDHDTFQAFLELEHEDFPLLPGVELTCDFEQKSIHILGYAFNVRDMAFQAFCQRQRDFRKERLVKMCELLTLHGTPIHASDVITTDDGNYTWGRVHIALQLMKKGYVPTVTDAFKRYIGDKSPSYVSGKKCTVQEAIDAIHAAKGFAVVAHPHLIDSKSQARRLLALNFDGIEAYYARFRAQENEHWAIRARAKNLFTTGGSDFHGLPKPESFLGSSYCPEDTFEMLMKHYQEISS